MFGAASLAQPPATSSSAPAQAVLPPGSRVTIMALQSKPELNGCDASVLSYDGAKGRYNVQISRTGAVLALKRDNLQPGSAPSGLAGIPAPSAPSAPSPASFVDPFAGLGGM